MTRRRMFGCGAAVAAMVFVASVLFAKPGVVVTNDGQRLEGEITEKGDEVTVNIRGINTVLSRGNIASITYSEPFEKEFQDRLAKLDPKDVKGRIELARWAFDQKHYPAAREALESALTIDPNNRDAADLDRLIRSQMRLEQTKQAAPAPPTTKPMTPEKPAPTNAMGQKLLTPADINLIRQWELRPTDTRTSVRLENNVDKRYIQYANLQFSEFNAKTPVDRAIDILDKGDPSMRKDVKIVTDPASLIEYKSMIQPMMLNGCATSNCHASSKGGAFQMLAPASSDAITYTNFYILTQYHKKLSDPNGGVFEGNVDRKMIERGHGADSILAQYMLPADVSKFDHPPVPGYNGVARNKDDVRFKQVVSWMDNQLRQIAPNYGIEYEIPSSASTTVPATQATQPAGPTRR